MIKFEKRWLDCALSLYWRITMVLEKLAKILISVAIVFLIVGVAYWLFA